MRVSLKEWLSRRLTRQNAVPYLDRLSRQAVSRRDANEVTRTIEQNGFWDEQYEWRISIYTKCRIERTTYDDYRAYRVEVTCDGRFEAFCPSVPRALEFVGIFERLQQDLFWTVGWPSWKTRDEL